MSDEPDGPWMILMYHPGTDREVWSTHAYACKRDADEYIDTFNDEWVVIYVQCIHS